MSEVKGRYERCPVCGRVLEVLITAEGVRVFRKHGRYMVNLFKSCPGLPEAPPAAPQQKGA